MALREQHPELLVDDTTGKMGYKNPVTNKDVTLDDPGNVAITGGVIGGASVSAIGQAAGYRRKVIIDTDWWTDVDDVLAIRMALEFERLGVWDVLGVALSATLSTGPRSLDTLCLYHSRSNMPIFIPKTSHFPGSTPPYQTNMISTTLPSGVSSALTSGAGGALAFNVPDAVAGMTRLLQDSTDPVEIIAIGYPVNLYELLLAQPALVASKVSKLWMMAGAWPSGSENNFNRSAQSRAAGNYVCANWPSPITLLGFEIGSTIITGGNLAALGSADPVSQALIDFGHTEGRSSWDPMMVLLAASGGVAAGGYTSVRGQASVDASTGANSFAVSSSGAHEYVVRSVGDNYYTSTINDLVYPNSARARFKRADGTYFNALPRTGIGANFVPSRGATTDADNLLHQWCAQDNSDIADASAVALVYDRVRSGGSTLTSTGTLQPTMSTQGSLRCWNFSGAQALTNAAVAVPPEITVYAKVRFASAPAAFQTVVANEMTVDATNGKRSFHLKSASGIAAQTTSYNGNTQTADNANASAITTAAWHVIALRRSITQLEALYDGATNGATTLSGGPGNTIAVPLNIGARKDDASSEPLTGYVREVRIYSGWHTDAQVAAVSAEM